MDALKRRWALLGMEPGELNGWHKKMITAETDTLMGVDTIAMIKSELPNDYRYAVALSTEEPYNLENYAFVGAIIIPAYSATPGVRWNWDNNTYQARPDMTASQVSLVLRTGQSVQLIWRTRSLLDDYPDIYSWNYMPVQPGANTLDGGVKAAIDNEVGFYDVIMSVADLDYPNISSLNLPNMAYVATICTSGALTNHDLLIRRNSGAYEVKSGDNLWVGTWDLVTDSNTNLVNFYRELTV